MPDSKQVIVDREYGPFGPGPANGVACDGDHVWVAAGEVLRKVDPSDGSQVRTLPVAADAGTAFDGTHLYQLVGEQIHKIERDTGKVVHTIPAPGLGRDAGMTWAEGALWVGQHRDRKIHRIDPDSGQITKTIESDRFVTGVTWTGGELWHATWEGDLSEIRLVDPESGEVLERFATPEGVVVTGLSSPDGERFYCGSGRAGTVRVVRCPRSGPHRPDRPGRA